MIRQSDDGTRIIFECRLIADPKPTIEWQQKGKTVKEDSRHKYIIQSDKHSHLASLELSNVSAEDAGEYKLIAKNKHGDGSATIALNFDHGKPQVPDGKAPRFPKKPTIRQDGANLVLECILEARPFPEITWFHGTKTVVEGKRHKAGKKEISTDTYQLSMEIKDPSTEDGGNYRCNAANELGESNANIALNFQGSPEEEDLSPQFVSKPQIIPKNGGALIVMECRVRSTTTLTTTWYRGSVAVKETTKIKSSIVDEKSGEYTVKLELTVSSRKQTFFWIVVT